MRNVDACAHDYYDGRDPISVMHVIIIAGKKGNTFGLEKKSVPRVSDHSKCKESDKFENFADGKQ